MNREQVYQDIKQTFGLVPKFFQAIPDSSLELEWQLFKRVQLEEGPVPPKYRELIGLGLSAATRCAYCAYFHTEAARLFGATEEEIEYTVHYAKASTGWSTYLNGLQFDLDQFKEEIRQIALYLREQHAKAA